MNLHSRPNRMLVAVSLTFILATASLVYNSLLPRLGDDGGDNSIVIPYGRGFIAIDGDADFSDKALLEGWPGDGSPEDPYIIDGLDIDLGGAYGNCISIMNTQVSFIISNCDLTGALMLGCWGAGIHLENVANGELVNNSCNGNTWGIFLHNSTSNTVVNNTCNSIEVGIGVCTSHLNTVANNTCNNNDCFGIIIIGESESNIVVNNFCTGNVGGIWLWDSTSNIITNNTCTSNIAFGVHLHISSSNTVANNTCNHNRIGIYLDSDLFCSVDEEGVVNDTHWDESFSNTVTNNICNNNTIGIHFQGSSYNTVENNTCNSNDIGIFLDREKDLDLANDLYWVYPRSNTVADNTCNYNRIGFYLYTFGNNIVGNNAFLGNTEHDIFEESATE